MSAVQEEEVSKRKPKFVLDSALDEGDGDEDDDDTPPLVCPADLRKAHSCCDMECSCLSTSAWVMAGVPPVHQLSGVPG